MTTFVFAAERTATELLTAAVVAAITIVAAALISRFLTKLLKQAGMGDGSAKLVARLVGVIIVLVGVVYALQILEVQIAPLFGAFGFSSVVIAFAFQGIITNFVASALLTTRQPFRPGDQIETGKHRGTVIEVNSRDVVLMTFDGNHVVVPSSEVLANPIHNFTADPIRRSVMPISLPYGCELREAQRAINRSVRGVEGVTELPAPEVLIAGFGDSGIDTNLRFWHPSEELTTRWVTSEVALAVVEALNEINVEIPFPHIDLVEKPAPASPEKPGLSSPSERD